MNANNNINCGAEKKKNERFGHPLTLDGDFELNTSDEEKNRIKYTFIRKTKKNDDDRNRIRFFFIITTV